MATKSLLQTVEEMGNQQRSQRYQSLLDRGIPVADAALLAAQKGEGFMLPNLDRLVERYRSAAQKRLPGFAAAIVATSEGTFNYLKDGLDRVVSNYNRLVQEGASEVDAAKRAVF